jgi:hypothetical protein
MRTSSSQKRGRFFEMKAEVPAVLHRNQAQMRIPRKRRVIVDLERDERIVLGLDHSVGTRMRSRN